jgi:hypothetical protein
MAGDDSIAPSGFLIPTYQVLPEGPSDVGFTECDV